MERKRLGPHGWTSVFSLMRDGKELAAAIRANQADSLVPNAIDPYLQVIEDSNERCQFTGLRLMDVWRYFRYNWAMPYNSVPGRSMLALVRDAVAPNHPIIGIAALGSAIVQLSQRDKWIGWTSANFVSSTQDKPTIALARWVPRQLETLTQSIYKADLIKAGHVTYRELSRPTEDSISRLLAEAKIAWELHRRFPHRSKHKPRSYDDRHWKREALTHLFRAKRCETLAQLLQVRRTLNELNYEPKVDSLQALLAHAGGKKVLEALVRASKAEHIGIDMLDITICGAVPPYNPLLAGKLTALLLCSPEIVQAYARRYKDAPSIIASSMAGRTVHRPPRLVLLGTTSLYGERLNQYHRVQIPRGVAGAKETIRYAYLGESVGYGSSHLCAETVRELELLLAQSSRGRRVNSIFGEGVSPRLRKIRDGLDFLGFPSDRVLNHGNPRLIYGVPLALNFRGVLVGLEKNPRYILPQRGSREVSRAIARYWGSRWLSPRVERRPELLDIVAVNDIRLPYQHSARVDLPGLEEDALPLFA
ncbi:DUF4338 domain-containing protein [Alloacidobacterium dinghuense]|uniref:DUF4338 domain-containing protein n=1 Tax=Alloacidobacterium dinghuense TaxID=2763107 RepID=A0A7G8BHS1_9BACT|nr:Druantia anti-phage system protein DruA [Alloacidobacterium dinghuense]QNI32091.1 DUF4338 domain-containing protein [Alloacidobacterium dinghuense]